MKKDKLLAMIGLATKAGKITSGEFSVEKSVKDKKSKLVIVADDASTRTKMTFLNMCNYYKVPIFYYSTKEMLGHCIGKGERSSVSINDNNFKEAIERIIKELENSNGGN